ncbi:MAG: AlpA family transcriptional regulator [Nitrococcus sp.]|nr:AlpA family transcriptional regulator [Nitrococcus sp.]
MPNNPRIRAGDRIVRRHEGMLITGVTSNTTWWRLIRLGVLPEPIHLTRQARGWIDRELYDALNKIAEKSGRGAA